MEILMRGTPPPEKTYVATCENCNSRLRFKQSEGQIDLVDPDDDCGHSKVFANITVTCPVCGKMVSKGID